MVWGSLGLTHTTFVTKQAQFINCNVRIDFQTLTRYYYENREHNSLNSDQINVILVRTQAAAEALEAGDYETMGRLMTESHVSLR